MGQTHQQLHLTPDKDTLCVHLGPLPLQDGLQAPHSLILSGHLQTQHMTALSSKPLAPPLPLPPHLGLKEVSLCSQCILLHLELHREGREGEGRGGERVHQATRML